MLHIALRSAQARASVSLFEVNIYLLGLRFGT
jgi:hypothetical protein